MSESEPVPGDEGSFSDQLRNHQQPDIRHWSAARDRLIEEHPLTLEDIREVVLKVCRNLDTDVTHGVNIFDTTMSSSVAGQIIEQAIAKSLKSQSDVWRPGEDPEKDVIHTEKEAYSFEVKVSGQIGDQIYGNRSYAISDDGGRKSKSGYYLTVNLHLSEKNLAPSHNPFLIRFGWVDHDDWQAQSSNTGQAAKLPDEVYKKKLRVVEGDYLQNAPLEIVNGIGPGTIEDVRDFLEEHDISTVGQFVTAYDNCVVPPPKDAAKVYRLCLGYPQNTVTMEQDITLFEDADQSSLGSYS